MKPVFMQAIGNTPLIKLLRLSGPGSAEIYVKYEGANPTGSMKDRMALAMIEGAEGRGDLKPGGRVIDYTGGSTGSSLAMVCATKGYHAHFVSSDAFSEEKLQTMKAFGATLELFPSDNRKITVKLIDDMFCLLYTSDAADDSLHLDRGGRRIIKNTKK